MESKDDNQVWYASYGSNILEERFLCYIIGGRPHGAHTEYSGCRDKRLPSDNEEISINSELYFARESKTWDSGGVAFIRNTFNIKSKTLGRMYLITMGQFLDVIKQENNIHGNFKIDFDYATTNGSFVFRESSWYGKIIYLGVQRDIPIFTFTHHVDLHESTRPSERYLVTIIRGIYQTYNLTAQDIVDYLVVKAGINGKYSQDELKALVLQNI